VETERIRRRWMNVLQRAFCVIVEDTLELVNYLAQKASDHLSKMTNAADEHCAIRLRTEKKSYSYKSSNLRNKMNNYGSQCSHQGVSNELIPRRYSADMYDSQGPINNACVSPLRHRSTSSETEKECTSTCQVEQQMETATMVPFDPNHNDNHLRPIEEKTCPSPLTGENSNNTTDEGKSPCSEGKNPSSEDNNVVSENKSIIIEGILLDRNSIATKERFT